MGSLHIPTWEESVENLHPYRQYYFYKHLSMLVLYFFKSSPVKEPIVTSCCGSACCFLVMEV